MYFEYSVGLSTAGAAQIEHHHHHGAKIFHLGEAEAKNRMQ